MRDDGISPKVRGPKSEVWVIRVMEKVRWIIEYGTLFCANQRYPREQIINKKFRHCEAQPAPILRGSNLNAHAR
ncbi:hypothetical protein DRW42_09350 [Pedobacter miscanthi]|uniref:Uncharacterized protein n=1 Tax=Pedobacter miscanthi TaxID=2259170 RepID=A0A366L5Z7_9SPHI|nr:hypothetical protein DRW42_09350 [Pedobacter miscanthi]